MGRELGGRPDNTAFYDDAGHVRYDLWSKSELFQSGLKQLIEAAGKSEVALLCSEEDPLRCHRYLLIARVLAQHGVPRSDILHIRADGRCIPDDELPRQDGLFGEDSEWRSPRSVLRKVQPSTSSEDFSGQEFDG
jgi:Domain of unknown function DUF488